MKKIILILMCLFTIACERITEKPIENHWNDEAEKVHILIKNDKNYFLITDILGPNVIKKGDKIYKIGKTKLYITFDINNKTITFYDKDQNKYYKLDVKEFDNGILFRDGKMYFTKELINAILFTTRYQLVDIENEYKVDRIDYDFIGTVDKDKLTVEKAKELLTEIFRMIKIYYPKNDFHKVDITKLEKKYFSLIEEVKSRDDFQELMNNLTDEFDNGHMGYKGIFSVEDKNEILTETNELLNETDFRFTKKYDLKYNNQEVLEINGKDFKDKNLLLFRDTLESQYFRKWLEEFGKVDKIKLDDNREINIKFNFIKVFTKGEKEDIEKKEPVKVIEISDNTVILDVDSWNFDEDEINIDNFENMIKDKNVIIDERNNRGGYRENSVLFLKIITNKKTYAYTLNSDGKIIYEKLLYGSKCIYPNFKDNKLILLTNNESYSASNYLAAIFDTNKLGEIIGERTGGGNYISTNYILSDNSAFLLPYDFDLCSPDGYDYEGGIEPTIKIKDEIVDGKDMVMAKALELMDIDYKKYEEAVN